MNKLFQYLKELRYYFLIIAILFVLAGIFSFIYPVFFKQYIFNLIQELGNKTSGMNFFELFIFIFKNNLLTSFMGVILGIFTIFPLIIALFNGYVLGFVSSFAVKSSGGLILLKLLPHGIFELPALILSLGLGLRLGMFILAKNKKKDLLYNLKNSFWIFVYFIIPLLIIAALIESLGIFFWK